MEYPAWINEQTHQFLKRFLIELSSTPEEEVYRLMQTSFLGVHCEKTIAMCKALRDQKLESVWVRAEKYYSISDETCEQGKFNKISLLKDGQVWLACATYYAYPTVVGQTSNKKAEEWRSSFELLLENLLELSKNAPQVYSHIFDDYRLSIKQLCHQTRLNGWWDGFDKPGSLLLQSFLDQADLMSFSGPIKRMNHLLGEAIQDEKFWGLRRGGKEGLRTYFVRSLTNSLIKRTGKPRREIVLLITNALFDGRITQQQVIDHTEDIVTEPEKFPDKVSLSSLHSVLESISKP